MSTPFKTLLTLGAGATVFSTLMAGVPVQAQEAQEVKEVKVAQVWGSTPQSYSSGTGFYATIGLGASWPRDVDWDARNLPISGQLDPATGFSGEAGIGYDFGAIRTELTYGYTRSSIDRISFDRGGSASTSGIINKNDVMASAYWDINTNSRWTPYIGGGIGYTNLSTPSISTPLGRTGGGNRGLFGYQAKAGVSYAASQSTDLFLEGVYQGATGFESSDVKYGPTNSFGAKLGARFRFGGPVIEPVAVTPEPAPAPYVAPAPQPEPFVEPAPQQPIRGLW